MSFTDIATRSMPTVPCRPAWKATFSLVPTPSVPATSTGSRYLPGGRANRPPKPPTPATTSGRTVRAA